MKERRIPARVLPRAELVSKVVEDDRTVYTYHAHDGRVFVATVYAGALAGLPSSLEEVVLR